MIISDEKGSDGLNALLHTMQCVYWLTLFYVDDVKMNLLRKYPVTGKKGVFPLSRFTSSCKQQCSSNPGFNFHPFFYNAAQS